MSCEQFYVNIAYPGRKEQEWKKSWVGYMFRFLYSHCYSCSVGTPSVVCQILYLYSHWVHTFLSRVIANGSLYIASLM